MSAPASGTGRLLWSLLPEMYRDGDDSGDLTGFIDGVGTVLDRVRATLDQRLADNFPDVPDSGRSSQPWLLPYFARLLDVRLLSPHVEGRRLEVQRAIRWRQWKGTLLAFESVAAAFTRGFVVVQEGWTRVVLLPRVGDPLLPISVYGGDPIPEDRPDLCAGHPGLPCAMVDLRKACRAVPADPHLAASHALRPPGADSEDAPVATWRHDDPHGVPCFPDSFEDASRRVVDIRKPAGRVGRYHPRRILVFITPDLGFFRIGQTIALWSQRAELAAEGRFLETATVDGGVRLSNPKLPDRATEPADTVVFRTPSVSLTQDRELVLEDLHFLGTLRVRSPRLELRRCAIQRLVLQPEDGGDVAFEAHDCLLGRVEVEPADAASRVSTTLEYCTVLGEITTRTLRASDCMLVGSVHLEPAPRVNCIRYSRIPDDLMAFHDVDWMRGPGVTTLDPVWLEMFACSAPGEPPLDSRVFGNPGHGVLAPEAPDALSFGSEDGGEMGAYHHQSHTLERKALATKLEDFMPFGLDAAIVVDPRLLGAGRLGTTGGTS